MTDPPNSNKSVAAVFVTMNRSATAATCLDRLKKQTLRPDKVIVVNNASTDDTVEMLDKLRFQEGEWIETINSAENVGNAGGINLGMNLAFAGGADSVWILDDDSWPEPEALRLLVDADVPEESVRACIVVDTTTGALSWPLQIRNRGGFKFVNDTDSLPKDKVIPVRRSWLGALIPRQVFSKVGPVNAALFLRGEDEDYPRRIERAGCRVFLVKDSVLHHPAVGKLSYLRLFGREVVLEQDLDGDKLYYRLRNSYWIARTQDGIFHAVSLALIHFAILFRNKKPVTHWFPIWLEASKDAFRNKLGKRA